MNNVRRLDWIDGIKGLAILGILLNHFVESFGAFPWFSYPSYNWPGLSERLSTILPGGSNIAVQSIKFLGWLGDMGPGVFIMVSGFSLALSSLLKNEKEISVGSYFKKRLLRIMPLYITIHILVVCLIVFFKNGNISLSSPHVLISLLGLRATDGLFFYINPSWWFIWLILQLYLVFPILYKYMIKADIRTFLFITIGFTFLSRAAGLLNVTYSDNLEYWMMGIFFGTRLSEFALGMVFAKLFITKQFNPADISISRLLPISTIIYLAGFICSLFYLTTIVSGTLVTVGFSGILLVLWKTIESNMRIIKTGIKWIGIVSFPVFLLHQPFLTWFGSDQNPIIKALFLLFVIILAFPAGWFLEWIVNKVVKALPVISNSFAFIVITFSISLQISVNIIFFFHNNNSLYQLDSLIFLFNILFILLYLLTGNRNLSKFLKTFLYVFVINSIVFCFVLTPNWFSIFWLITLLQLVVVFFASRLTGNLFLRVSYSAFIILTIVSAGEYFLSKKYPAETNRWGEFPALKKDPLTVYSLIPDKVTHLKYNNYDYFVKTNSLGFNGPEIDLSVQDSLEYRILIIGDAFTMPEGMDYEKGYPELIRNELSEKFPLRNIKVFNAGVTGFGPNEMFAQLSKYIDTIKPDLYINEVFINEFEEINLDSTARLNSLKFSKMSIRNELFSGSQIPVQTSYLINKFLRDKYYLNYEYLKSLAYFYETKSDLFIKENLNRIKKYFIQVKILCEKNNCLPIILYAPGQLEISRPDEIDYYPYHIPLDDKSVFDLKKPRNIYKELTDSVGIRFLDPTFQLKENKVQPVYFKGSWHWNPEGHKVIAAFLSQEIAKGLNSKQVRKIK